MKDVLIVGHGIAGALLGYQLEQAKQNVHFIDAPEQIAATNIAAGIINPITGRRFVKSWLIDTLAPLAQQTYEALEKELGIPLYHPLPLIRALFNRGDENSWQARLLDDDYQAFMSSTPELGNISALTKPAFAYAQVLQTARVAIGQLQRHLRQQRRDRQQLHEETFDYQQLNITEQGISYKDIKARRIVFCEGWRGQYNPFFHYLPFGGNKGDTLRIRIRGPILKRMFKHRVFLVPISENEYWVGSTSQNTFDKEEPQTTDREFLESRLKEILNVPFEVISHKAAVRPTVKDRRPFVGQHPRYSAMYILNGLGTKGASLAPYASQQLIGRMLHGQALDPIIDIKRYATLFS